MPNWLTDPSPEHVFEISEFALAGASPRQPEAQYREHFHERGLTASPSLPNLARPQLYRDALTQVTAAGTRRNTTALVIPDYAARMAIIDFEEFPAREEERIALLRFRLKKTVPFHIDEARVAYAIQESRQGHVEVLAVAIAGPILLEYESVFVEAGFRVGLVVPSLVAALAFCGDTSDGITLLAKSAGSTLSIGLVDSGFLRLVRSIDLSAQEGPGDAPMMKPAFSVLQQTVAFAEDQLQQKVTRAVLCGFGENSAVVGSRLERVFGIPWSQAQSRFGPPLDDNAGMLGLLEQFAA